MLGASLLQQSWRFDWYSALIGAVAAWILAGLAYYRRASLQATAERLWEPVAQWRAQMRASVEEKYLAALKEALRGLLLFHPQDPSAPFVPPTFLSPAPLPTQLTSEIDLYAQLRVPYDQLLKGHARLFVTGTQGVGRTTALALTVWEKIGTAADDGPFSRFPLWIDLKQLDDMDIPEESTENEDEAPPLERFTRLAVRFLPQAREQWLEAQLQEQPSLILVDNWDTVPAARKRDVGAWFATVADELPESRWIVTGGTTDYGPLIEAHFVAIDLEPTLEETALTTLIDGWRDQVTRLEHPQEEPEEAEDDETAPEEPVDTLDEEDLFATLKWALVSGDELLALTTRTWLFMRDAQAPTRLMDALNAVLQIQMPYPELGDEPEKIELAEEAYRITERVLENVAYQQRLEGKTFSQEDFDALLEEQLPPPAERAPQLENTVHRLLKQNPLFSLNRGQEIGFSHFLWRELFAARKLTAIEDAIDQLRPHLNDPEWRLLLECYVGLGADARALIVQLLRQSLRPEDHTSLLIAARWAVLAPEDAGWRKNVMKALAQSFAQPGIAADYRIAVGQALALVAGESALPFYLQVLKHPRAAVRAAALRGVGWTGGPKQMRALASGLTDEDFDVRVSAVRGLGDLGTSGAVRFLKDHLVEADEELMLIIAAVLAETPEGGEALKEATQADDLLVRRAAVHGLGQIDEPWTRGVLERVLREDSQWLVRSAAEAALSERGEEETDPSVPAPPRVDEAQWLIAWAAQQGLGVGLDEAAMQMLLRALEVGDVPTQVLGAQTLAQIGHQEHLTALRSLLSAENEAVHEAAQLAMASIKARYQGIAAAESEPDEPDEVEEEEQQPEAESA